MNPQRTITISIFNGDLPKSLNGVCRKNDTDNYSILLNNSKDEDIRVAAFLHECLHIYHKDFDNSRSIDEIETERHAELTRLLEILTEDNSQNTR